jgi:hypothetical protein
MPRSILILSIHLRLFLAPDIFPFMFSRQIQEVEYQRVKTIENIGGVGDLEEGSGRRNVVETLTS